MSIEDPTKQDLPTAQSDIQDEKKTPSDFFERNPKIEHLLFKQGGEEPVDVTLKSITGDGFVFKHAVSPDMEKINDLYLRGREKPYTIIHNHPTKIKSNRNENSFPSYQDLDSFLIDDEVKTTVIYQHNPTTNKSEGMFVIRKTDNTPKSGIKLSGLIKGIEKPKDAEDEIERRRPGLSFRFAKKYKHSGPLHDYFNLEWNQDGKFGQLKLSEDERRKERQRLLIEIAEQMHLQIKFVPAEGFCYEPGKGFIKDKK